MNARFINQDQVEEKGDMKKNKRRERREESDYEKEMRKKLKGEQDKGEIKRKDREECDCEDGEKNKKLLFLD